MASVHFYRQTPKCVADSNERLKYEGDLPITLYTKLPRLKSETGAASRSYSYLYEPLTFFSPQR